MKTVLVPCVALSGCLFLGCTTSSSLTPDGERVKFYWSNRVIVVGCRDLGVVLEPNRYGGIDNDEARNAAAARGAQLVVGTPPRGAIAYQCESGKQIGIPKIITLDEQQVLQFTKQGSASVAGQAFLKTRGGDVKYAAGNLISLDPAVDYYKAMYLQKEEISIIGPDADPWWVPATGEDWKRYRRETQADGEGRFSFSGLPPGKYLVSTKIVWSVPSAYSSSSRETGGWVGKEFSVQEGARVDVILSEAFLPSILDGNTPR